MPPEAITFNQAVDRLVTTFDARGWREDGETAQAIAREAIGAGSADPSRLAAVVRPPFLVSNGIDRAALEAAIAAALSNAFVVSSPAVAQSPRGDTHITVSNSGTMIGPIGGGVVSGVHVQQQQVMGDEAIRSLVGEYIDHPDVRQVIDSDLPDQEKRSRLTAFLQGAGNFASDTLAKIVTGLMTQS